MSDKVITITRDRAIVIPAAPTSEEVAITSDRSLVVPAPAATDETVVVTRDRSLVVNVNVGPQGPAGPQGSAGAPGPAGGESYIHDQLAPSTVWVIAHHLVRFPSVTVVDSGGTMVVGDVTYTDDENLTITFSAAFGGRAFLN